MTRVSFSQVIKNANIDIRREYERLYGLFCLQRVIIGNGQDTTLRDTCAYSFSNLPFRGTCISLDDFDDYYGYHFEKVPSGFDLDYLVSFCEYTYNLAIHNQRPGYGGFALSSVNQAMQFYIMQTMKVIESIGYMANTHNWVTDFVPKDQIAIAVAEIIDPGLSYKVIEYNHHSMKGNMSRKKDVLLALADKLEPQRPKLKQINCTFESDLFFLFNSANLRHNNTDPAGNTKYISYVASLSSDELEKWYDDIYQMCLLAFLELDHTERKERINQFKKEISSKKS